MSDAPEVARTDQELLAGVRPRGARGALRRLGCPIVLGIAGYLSWRTGGWIADLTWPWVIWVATPLLFVPAGVVFSAVLAVIAGSGDPGSRGALLARVGQRPLDAVLLDVHGDLAEVASGQTGWVVILQGLRAADGFRFQVRVDLRTDVDPIQGEATGVRGPRLDLWVKPPRTLEAWQRLTRPLGGEAEELSAWLAAADLSQLPTGKPTSGALRFEGAVIRLGAARNEWRLSGGLEGRDGSVLGELVWRSVGALDWDPTASPVP